MHSIKHEDCLVGKIEDRGVNSLFDCKENYSGSIILYKRGEIFKLRSLLCLKLGSWCGDGKWILFFVDRVNVRTSWESSLWIVDEVTQLLSTKNLKETIGKNKLELSKFVRRVELSFSFQLEILVLLRLTTEVLFYQEFFRPLFHSKLGNL